MLQPRSAVEIWRLVERQHGVVSRQQLLAVGLSPSAIKRYVNSHRVDFVWPELGLVVETDSLRYHRTALQQWRDRERDHAHLGVGLLPLRFTHYQVRYQPQHVLQGLADGVRMVRTAH
jgi:very-short-patch-repair endonuclease